MMMMMMMTVGFRTLGFKEEEGELLMMQYFARHILQAIKRPYFS